MMIDRGIETARDVILLPRKFKGRDTLIRNLVGVCGWRREKVASIFKMTVRQVQRITRPASIEADIPGPDDSSTVTHREMRSMVNDYANDPYTSIEEREAAWEFIARGCPRTPR